MLHFPLECTGYRTEAGLTHARTLHALQTFNHLITAKNVNKQHRTPGKLRHGLQLNQIEQKCDMLAAHL